MELKSDSINEIASALSKAQLEIKGAVEDKINPHFKSTYSSLYSIIEASKEPLSKNGLSVSQITTIENEILMLVTILMHSSGQWIQSYLPVVSVKSTPQAIGSAITYMRRYSYSAITGVAPSDDDDGNAAEEKNYSQQREAKPVRPQTIIQTNPSNQIEAPKQQIKLDGYSEFVQRHRLYLEDENAIPTGKYEFILETCKKTNLDEIEVINAAIKNEKTFEDRFKNWNNNKKG